MMSRSKYADQRRGGAAVAIGAAMGAACVAYLCPPLAIPLCVLALVSGTYGLAYVAGSGWTAGMLTQTEEYGEADNS